MILDILLTLIEWSEESNFDILSTLDIPIDQEAINSIKMRRPLALMEPMSASGKAIAKLCKILLEIEWAVYFIQVKSTILNN